MINFPFGTNGKLMVLGVPIFKHFRVNINELAKILTNTKDCCTILTII